MFIFCEKTTNECFQNQTIKAAFLRAQVERADSPSLQEDPRECHGHLSDHESDEDHDDLPEQLSGHDTDCEEEEEAQLDYEEVSTFFCA